MQSTSPGLCGCRLFLLFLLLLLLHDLCVTFLQTHGRAHRVAQELFGAIVDTGRFLVVQLLTAEGVHTVGKAQLHCTAKIRDSLCHAHLFNVLLHLALKLSLAHYSLSRTGLAGCDGENIYRSTGLQPVFSVPRRYQDLYQFLK